MRTLLALAAAAALLPLPAFSQNTQRPADSTRRDPTNTLPLVTTRNVTFTTDQGTWMSVDASPNGSSIVFDLLGDIYTMPISGGKATRIVGGNSIDMHPRYSPDGASIVFISDRGGADATWIADADGKRIRLLTQGGHYPAFTPDGKEVVTGNRLVDLRGGAGVQLPGFGTGASFTADGRYIWYQAGRQAARYDRTTGESSYRTNLPGGVLRPMVSRDGKSLAYFTRFEAQMALVIRDLATGADRWVLMGTQQEAGTLPVAAQAPAAPAPPEAPAPGGGRGGGGAQPGGVGPLPGSAWLANGSAIITSFGGKLWRVEVSSGTKTQIPFTADVQQSLGPLVKGSYEISDSVVVREIREPSLSPDGQRVAFTALGKIWVMDLDVPTPRRLTAAAGTIETSPAWTPDGRSIAYATWVDGDGGDIHIVDANGGAPRNLTRAPAMYTRLNFTPNGSRLVFARAPRHARNTTVDDDARTAELNLELRWMAATGGEQHPIIMVTDVGALPLGGFPHFTSDTGRVLLHDGTALVSLRWDGTDRKIVLAGATPQTLLAPDGVRVLSRAGRRNHIYMFERPSVTDSLVIDPTAGSPPVPVRRLTRAAGGGEFPSWSRDGSKAVWSSGATLHVYDVPRGDKATADSIAAALNRLGAPPAADSTRRPPAAADSSTRSTAAYEAARHEIRISVAADKPTGVVALRGARIITMNAGEVIANGDIVITDNRITAVGARGKVAIPSGARIINVAGKTILPGYVDVHAAINTPSQIHRTLVPQYMANLAFGVTTARDPESRDLDTFAYSDLVSTGDLLGPRIFATGPPVLDATASIANAAEGRTFMAPYANELRTNSVRGDLTATRTARQRFLQVGKELGLTAVAMSSPDFKKSLSAILDGYADHQAAYEIFPLQDDLAKLIAESGLTYTPMLLGRVGARTGMHHILATENPHADPKVRRFYYHKDLDRLTRAGATWTEAEEFPFQDIGAGAARIVAAGGKVALGSNGSVQGLGLHWEMWLMAKGGMPAHDILRAATLSGAESIGVGAQLGSIQTGKLADLQVLDLNPLTNIRNTNSVRYVMKNGRLYDAATLDQISPVPVKLGKLWWLDFDPTGGDR